MFFSVVMTLYNKEAYIRKTLKSVLRQTHTDFEVIIVDDGSTDTSVQIVNEFNDQRIKLHQQLNQGVSVARNIGVEKAKSNYVALLDADDEWLPNHLDNFTDLVNMYPVANMWVSGYRKSTKPPTSLKQSTQRICLEEYLDFRLANTPIAWTSAVLLNKDIFNKTNGFIEGISHGEDQALWLEMCLQGSIVKSFRETAIYNVYDNSLSTKLVKSEEEDACIVSIKSILNGNRELPHHTRSKLLELSCRYALAHVTGALVLQQPSIAKSFLELSHGTEIYRKRRYLLFILWFFSLLTPRLVAKVIVSRRERINHD